MTRRLRVDNVDRAAVLGEHVGVADGWWSRYRGLLGRASLPPGHGLLLSPCRGVHMLGMAFDLDVVFVDRGGVVVGVHHALRRGLHAASHPDAVHTLELPSGTLRRTGTLPGDRLVWQPVAPAGATPAASPRRGDP